MGQSSGAAIFTGAITVFLLAPDGVRLRGAAQRSAGAAAQPGDADNNDGLPRLAGQHAGVRALADRAREHRLALSGALSSADAARGPGALLGWAQSLGQFTFHHALTLSFTVLLLGFLYQEGGSLAGELTAVLRHAIGDRAERYVDVGTRAVRSSVNSMLVVGVFDALATALAYAAAGAPRPLLWAAITGSLAAVPFLGYAAVGCDGAASSGCRGAPTTALLALMLGCAVLLCGDKLVRPMVARDGVRLPFVWVLMGCIGGFGVLGLAGLAIGPVVLSLVRGAVGAARGTDCRLTHGADMLLRTCCGRVHLRGETPCPQ